MWIIEFNRKLTFDPLEHLDHIVDVLKIIDVFRVVKTAWFLVDCYSGNFLSRFVSVET